MEYNMPSNEELAKMQSQFSMKYKRLHPDAKAPEKAHPNDLGWDLFSIDEYEIPPFNRMVISTGIAIQFPTNTGAFIRDRSGIARDQGVFVQAGTVDPNYTGEIQILLFNSNASPVIIKKGTKIAQFVLMPVFIISSLEEVGELEQTDRSDQGFGSSGQ